jgi:hypothetical protein
MTIWMCVTFLRRLFTIRMESFFERWTEARSLERKVINIVFGNNSYWRNVFVSKRMLCSSLCFAEPLLCIYFENMSTMDTFRYGQIRNDATPRPIIVG